MARIIGGIGSTRIPLNDAAMAESSRQAPCWKPFFDACPKVREWLARVRPEVAIVLGSDHGLNFLVDRMPTFAIGAAAAYRRAGTNGGLPASPPFCGAEDLSRHLAESLVRDEFDIVICQEMTLGPDFSQPLDLLWREATPQSSLRLVPVLINTARHPLPSPARCYKFGQAIGRAIESWAADARVLVLGNGGLSQPLEGKRAAASRKFDLMFIDKLVSDPLWVTRYSIHELVELTGTREVELLIWLAMRGALLGEVEKVHADYHAASASTASGLLVMEGV